MYNSRRDFLKASGMVVMAGAAGYLGTERFIYGQSATDVTDNTKALENKQRATLVTIFLRGGADALNTFVPAGDKMYYEARQRIALKAEAPTKGKGKGGEAGVLPIGKGGYWGINAKMASLLPLIEKGIVVPIMNVGSPNGTRSHFSAQDYMERGALGDSGISNGWLNRYLEASKKPYDAPLRGLSAQTLVPRALRGPYPVLAGNNSTEQMELFETLYSTKNMVNMNARDGANDTKGSRLDELNKTAKAALTADSTRDIIAQSGANAIERIRALEKAEQTENTAEYPGGGLSGQLKTIAKVIKANVGLEVAQADYGGWDHHSAQGGAGGHHAQMLGHLADCLVAFHEDLGSRMDRVMVLVMSEFGRTVQDNGANGTDHGRGGFMIAMGNMLKGNNKVWGVDKWDMRDLDYGRFLPVHNDFRAVFAESLVRLFHFDPFAGKVFPDYQATPKNFLGFMKQQAEV
ncbi:MAG TPA: DUF1501 domain-containing protein [Tepidisphaeraceae bacterium]|nr:DUF1501 domain-containing protein [Tepidisphaeraceae bacterium]